MNFLSTDASHCDVQHNFTLVVLAIVLISVLPIAFELIAARREQKPSAD